MGALHQNEEEGQVRPAPGAISVQVGTQTHLVAVSAGVEGCGEVLVSAQSSAHAATSPGNTHAPLRVEGTRRERSPPGTQLAARANRLLLKMEVVIRHSTSKKP